MKGLAYLSPKYYVAAEIAKDVIKSGKNRRVAEARLEALRSKDASLYSLVETELGKYGYRVSRNNRS